VLYSALASGSGDQGFARGLVDVPWPAIVGILSAVTMTLGNLSALHQTNLKRLLAYSSISHAGFALMGLSAASLLGVQSVMVYLLIYLVMNLGAFLAVIVIAQATACCPERHRRGSGGFTLVVIEETSEPRAADNRAIGPIVVRGARLALDQLAVQPLMETLGVIVLHKFLDQVPQMSLAENHEVFATLCSRWLSACKPRRGRKMAILLTKRTASRLVSALTFSSASEP
jgi:hypothetical protein